MVCISLNVINQIERLVQGYFLLCPQEGYMIIIKNTDIYCLSTLSTVAMLYTEVSALAPHTMVLRGR